MSVLSANECTRRLANPEDEFFISPILDWRSQVSSSSIDLRLDSEFIIITRSRFASIDPMRREHIAAAIHRYQRKLKVGFGEKIVLHPQELVIGSTVEFLSFPDDLMAYVIGRSSWGRLGLIIATATQINPGFKGNLTLELVNEGNVPIVLYPGVRIAQIVVHSVDPAEKARYSSGDKYDLQIGPGFSKIHEDTELLYLHFPSVRTAIGLTGHKGSGKSVLANYLVEDCSYRYYSLSHIVRDHFSEKHIHHPSREDLQDFGDSLREEFGADYLARELLRRLQSEDEVTSDTKIVIDGIRNPAEALLLKRLNNFTLLGLEASKERIKENLRKKGYLLKDEDYRALQKEVEEEVLSESRKAALGKTLKDRITESTFEANYARDSGATKDDEYGQNIDACMKNADAKIRNDEDVVTLIVRLRELLADLEL